MLLAADEDGAARIKRGGGMRESAGGRPSAYGGGRAWRPGRPTGRATGRREERRSRVDPEVETTRKNQYRTTSRQQMDERALLLRGGAMDGRRCSATVGVGQRVFCGEGPWSTEGMYLVTADEVVDADGLRRNVAIPAFA